MSVTISSVGPEGEPVEREDKQTEWHTGYCRLQRVLDYIGWDFDYERDGYAGELSAEEIVEKCQERLAIPPTSEEAAYLQWLEEGAEALDGIERHPWAYEHANPWMSEGIDRQTTQMVLEIAEAADGGTIRYG